jgi:hypothetical protein
MNTKNKDTEPKITIDDAKTRELAAERIRAIDKRVAELKAERTALNRQKHMLLRCLAENAS